MNRIAGIALAVVGLLVVVLSVAKLAPGLTQQGIVMCITGGLVIGLSFIRRPEPDTSEQMATPSTFGNIFFAPSDVFKSLRSHPRFLGALIIMAVLTATYSNLFLYRMTPERVTNFAIDKTLEMPIMNDQAKAQVEAGRADAIAESKNPVKRVAAAITGFCGSLWGYAFLALVFLLIAMAMGGRLNFWQAFSVAVYAAFPIAVIRFVLNTVILFIKDPSDIHPILGQTSLIQDNLNFLVLPAEHPVIFTLLGSLSLLGFYWIWLNATGLKNGGERVTGTIAWSSSVGVYALLVILGMLLALLFPSFIS
jgi:multisubunit Na+/H+ antiporter MnhB subunit